MMRKVLVLLALCFFVCGAMAIPSLTDYGNTTTLNINITPSMGAQTDYQLKFILSNSSGTSNYYAPDNVVYTNGMTRPDWYDINVTDSADAPLPFWVENNTATAHNVTVWVKVQTIAIDNSSGLKWRYGNSSQSASTMDGRNTFPFFFDDFSVSTLNATLWGSTGSVTISGGIADIIRSGADSQIKSAATFADNNGYALRTRVKTKHLGSSSYSEMFGYEYGGYADQIFILSSTGTIRNYISASSSSMPLYGYTADTYFIPEIVRQGNTTWRVADNTSWSYITGNYPSGAATLEYRATDGLANSEVFVDWVLMRKYIAIPPTTSLYTTSAPISAPVANFTCTPTSVSIGNSITCTDASTNSPTNWTYHWGDGNVTDGTQNPSYTYPFTGTYSVNQTVNNTAGSSWYNRSNYITVANASGWNQLDLEQTGQYITTFTITDSSTGAAIPVVTITSSGGQSNTTSTGTGSLTYPAGTYVAYFAATGYTGKSMSFIVDGDSTHAVQLVAAGTNEPVYNVYPPKDVKFHITSFFGAPISGASVTIQGITTSTGNWDWLVTLLGISLDEVAINGTAMAESTDTNGDVVFLMLPSVKYNITTTATGYTFPTTFIAPQAIEYTIIANWNESWFSSGNDTLKDVNVSVSWVKINSTHSFVNITYDDQTTTTTGGDFRIYREAATRMANATPIAVMNITSSSCSNSTIVDTPTGGAEYRVDVNASTTSGDRVLRTFTHSFKGAPVNLPGWTPETQLWLALFILIFTAAFAGVLHAPQMGVILCVELWVFWSIGWMEYLINGNGYTEAALLIVFTLATFFTVIWSITEGKSKGKRSS